MMARRFRLEPVVPTEVEFHEAVASLMHKVVLPPAFWTCFPAGHVQLTPAQAARLTRAGMKRGLPDFLLWHAPGSYGLELKRPKGHLSKGYMARTARGALVWREGQAEVFPRLETAGMLIAVCTSLDAVIVALRGWGIPLRIGGRA